MKSIQLHCTLFPLNTQPKHIKQSVPCFSSNNEALRFSTSQSQRCRFSQSRCKAIHTNARELVLALASPPAKSPEELWAFLGTSVLLFFMFWMTNFVAPEFISKYYEFDKVKEDQNDDDDEDDEDDES